MLRLICILVAFILGDVFPAAEAVTQTEIDNARKKGLAWLLKNQLGDGSWQTVSGTEVAATATAVDALAVAGVRNFTYSRGVAWLHNIPVSSVDSAARILTSLTGAGVAGADRGTHLATWRNAQQAWGAYDHHGTSFPDTALALGALRALPGGYPSVDAERALCAILSGQRQDGSWSYTPPPSGVPVGTAAGGFLVPTVHNLLELQAWLSAGWTSVPCGATSPSISPSIDNGLTWLLGRRASDGGFGDSGSSVLETALAYRALVVLAPTNAFTEGALGYLITTQRTTDGSWNADALQTALALRAFPPPVSPLEDTDVDGVPDAVEQPLGLNPNVSDSRELADGGRHLVITSIEPNRVSAGGARFELIVNGAGFDSSSEVRLNALARLTTFVSPTLLKAWVEEPEIKISTLLGVQTLGVTVVSSPPDRPPQTSNSVPLTVIGPALSVSARQLPVGDSLRVAFANGLKKLGTKSIWNSQWIGLFPVWVGSATTSPTDKVYVTTTKEAEWKPAGEIVFPSKRTIPADDYVVRWMAGTTILAESPVVSFVSDPTLAVDATTISNRGPVRVTFGSSWAFPVEKIGLFLASSTGTSNPADWLYLNNTRTLPGNTIVIRDGTLRFLSSGVQTITAGTYVFRWFARRGTSDVIVATSSPITVLATNPTPVITTLTPAMVRGGVTTAMSIRVDGEGFVSGASVRVNGVSRTTTFTSFTRLTVSVPAADLAEPGTLPLTVLNPGSCLNSTCTSNEAALTVLDIPPAPTITSLTPGSVPVGFPAFTLNVIGTDFVPGSTVRINGANRTTTFVSQTELTASIPASDAAAAASKSVTVFTPTPGGGLSAAQTLSVLAPALTVSATSMPLQGPLNVTVSNGPGTTGEWVGIFLESQTGTSKTLAKDWMYLSGDRTTSIVARDRELAFLSSAVTTLTTPGTYVVRWAKSGNQVIATGPSITVQAISPPPSVASLSPASVAAGAAGFTLTVDGVRFLAGATVQVAGTVRSSTFVSETRLTTTIPASDVTTPGALDVVVTNPSPCFGNACQSNVMALGVAVPRPAPTLTSISPLSVPRGSAAVTLTVKGTDFTPTSAVVLDGTALPTTFVSPNRMTAMLAAASLTVARSHTVAVVTETKISGTLPFVVTGPTLSLSASVVEPGGSVLVTFAGGYGAGSESISLVPVTGSSTDSQSVPMYEVMEGSWAAFASGTLTFPSETYWSQVPGGYGSGTYVFRWVSDGSGVVAESKPFTVAASNPVPVISSVSPITAGAGSPPLTLIVNGSSFRSSSQVHFNGTPVTTAYQSGNRLDATIPANALTTTGVLPVTVVTPSPGGGTSNARDFTITELSVVIVDDGQPETSFTGTWTTQADALAFGSNAAASASSPATYRWTPTIGVAGTYEVAMWWTPDISRAATAPIVIAGAGGVTYSTVINQQLDGGTWLSLGTFTFDAGAANYIEISAEAGPVVADAVRLVPLGTGATHRLTLSRAGTGMGTVTGSAGGLDCGQSCTASFVGETVITLTPTPAPGSSFMGWAGDEACADGIVTLTANTSCVAYFDLDYGITIDNSQPETSFTGTWTASAAAGAFGDDSLESSVATATFRWTPTIEVDGCYSVYLWWTASPTRATAVPITINTSEGAEVVTVNQQHAGGMWHLLGWFPFVAGTEGYVELAASAGQASADAIQVVPGCGP